MTIAFSPPLIVDWESYREVVPVGSDPERGTAEWEIRQEVVTHYYFLTKRMAAKMAKSMPAHVERDDLESLAALGLLKAVKLYNHTLNVPFEAYAMKKMWSAIRDGVRDQDWAPRSLRRKQREVETTETILKERLGRTPSFEEIAEELGVEPDDVTTTKYKSEISTHTHIESSVEALNKPVGDIDEGDLLAAVRVSTARALQNLPVKEATVVALHYYAGKKLADVAVLMGISSVKAGQLHANAVATLCLALEETVAAQL